VGSVVASDDELVELARDVDKVCRLRGRFTLRSGIEADEYFDKFLFEADPALLRRIVDRMVSLVPSNTDVLGGIELGGVPIAAVAGQVTGLPTAYIRKQPKTYGTCKLAEGSGPVGAARDPS